MKFSAKSTILIRINCQTKYLSLHGLRELFHDSSSFIFSLHTNVVAENIKVFALIEHMLSHSAVVSEYTNNALCLNYFSTFYEF